MLRCGAMCSVTARVQDGGTGLIAATQCGHLEVVKLLLEKGANIHMTKKVCRHQIHGPRKPPPCPCPSLPPRSRTVPRVYLGQNPILCMILSSIFSLSKFSPFFSLSLSGRVGPTTKPSDPLQTLGRMWHPLPCRFPPTHHTCCVVG